jgi:hypothetical protein
MKRLLILLALISVTFAMPVSPQDSGKRRKVACETEQNEKTCYWVHGRLSLYNGGPPDFRLWKIGTHRLLSIYSGPGFGPFDAGFNEQDDLELPANLNKYDFTKVSVFGDFQVCPLAPEKEGRVQPVALSAHKTSSPRTIERSVCLNSRLPASRPCAGPALHMDENRYASLGPNSLKTQCTFPSPRVYD